MLRLSGLRGKASLLLRAKRTSNGFKSSVEDPPVTDSIAHASLFTRLIGGGMVCLALAVSAFADYGGEPCPPPMPEPPHQCVPGCEPPPRKRHEHLCHKLCPCLLAEFEKWPDIESWCRKVYGLSDLHPPFAPWIENPCGSVDCDFMPPPPPSPRRYSTAADAIFLFRDDPALDSFAGAFAADITGTNGLDVGVMPRLQVMVPIDDIWDLEATGFGVDSWHVTGDYDLPGVLSGALDFNSQLFSAEVNFRHNTRDWLQLLWGFRWAEFSEYIDFTAPSVGLPAAWHLDAQNFFYGLQIGADVGLLSLWDRVELTGFVKGGVYDNRADWLHQVQTVGAVSTFENQFDEVAFLGEAALTLTVRCSEHSALRGGYHWLVLDEVTQAIESFTVNETDGLDRLFFHGAFAGVELRW
jgi:hypothetical protein